MSSLGFSFIDSKESNNTEQSSKKKRCRTLRKKHKKKSKIDNLLNSLNPHKIQEGVIGGRTNGIINREYVDEDDEDDDHLPSGNFSPLTDDQLSSAPVANSPVANSPVANSPVSQVESGDEAAYDDPAQTIENFTQLSEVTNADYYKQYVPYYNQTQGSQEQASPNKENLMKKLNYMIHLLEEGQDEKTDNVTEELVLYLFLGVFVIYVVDSFARAGKYTR
jgi:hypothetical protein